MRFSKAASGGAALYLLAVFSLKLLAVSDSEIIASRYDASAYAYYAIHWFWWVGSYPAFHPPGYPLWLALVRETGIPLRLAADFLYLVSSAYLATAVAVASGRRWLFFALLPVLAFAPVTFDLFRYVLSDTLAASLSNGAVAALILSAAAERRRILHSVVLAMAFGFAAITRPESAIMLGTLALVLAFLLARAIAAGHAWRRLARDAALVCLLPTLSIIACQTAVRAANRSVFGIAGIDVPRGDALTRAYDSLLRIDAGAGRRYLPVDRAVRALAYQASPSLATLEARLESPDSSHVKLTKRFYGVEDLATIWIQFAILAAIDATYPGLTPADRDALLYRIADEIDAALARHQIPQRRIVVPWLDPRWSLWVPHLPESLLRVARDTFLPRARQLPGDDCDEPQTDAAMFDSIANRRPALAGCAGPAGAGRPLKNAYYNAIEAPLFLVDQALSIGGLAASVALVIAGVVAWRSGPCPPQLLSLLSVLYLVGSYLLCRVLFYAVVDAAFWRAQERFLLPAMPLASAASVITVAALAELAWLSRTRGQAL